MRYAEVAANVQALIKDLPPQSEFVYEFLLAYGTPNTSIARLKSGQMNLAKADGELLLKKKLYFKAISGEADNQKCNEWPPEGSHIRMSAPLGAEHAQVTRDDQGKHQNRPKPAADLFAALDSLKAAKVTQSNDPRFLFVTDFEQVVAFDRKTADSLTSVTNIMKVIEPLFLSDFAAETAVLALWLTEHQMNLESKKVCGQAPDNLPLRDGAQIVCANACRIDWADVCPKEDGDEIYILGNPPYLGKSEQGAEHKTDMAHVFSNIKGYKNLDYIACWFFKASSFIRSSSVKSAFVTTNSICQGEQVSLLWPHLLKDNLENGFAHQSFKWTNNAKGNAGVTCAIVGLRQKSKDSKYLYKNGIEKVRLMRQSSKKKATREDANHPHEFSEIRYKNLPTIIIPEVSSERREYIPTGFLDQDTIISNLAYAVAGATPTIFGLLTSRMHMTWVRAVAGRLKTDYRYSAGLCYNTFPVPNLNEAQKQELTGHVMEVLQQRENHPEKTMAQLYDPDKMPAGLRAAHHQLDLAVDRLYRKAPFTSDEERLEHLFKRYEAMIAAEQKSKK